MAKCSVSRRLIMAQLMAGCSLLVAGCGGGGSGAVAPPAPPPPPPPAPPPPAPPPPPPPTNTSLTDLRFDQTFFVPFARLRFGTSSGIGGAFQVQAFPISNGNIFKYVAADQSYIFDATQNFPTLDGTIPADTTIFTFPPSDINRALSTADTTVYGTMRLFQLFKPGNSNPILALNFASFGSIAVGQNPRAQGDRITETRPFSYGIPAPAVSVARSGTETYRGVLRGQAVGERTILGSIPFINATGTFELTIDFTSKTLTGNVVLSGTVLDGQGNPLRVDNFGTFPINRSGPLTTLPQLSGTVGTGEFQGMLAGPNAEEVSFTFSTSVVYTGVTPPIVIPLVASAAGKR